MDQDEGYIKFQSNWTPSPPFPDHTWQELAFWRQRLYLKNWIGVYPDGIGFGNISCREVVGQVCPFLITGSKTGQFELSEAGHFSRVTDWSAEKNTVCCTGPVVASSESMSHAAIYASLPQVKVVMHIHDMALWERHLWEIPTTPATVPYGSPEMVYALQSLFRPIEHPSEGVVAMAGHREGLFAFGASFASAYRMLTDLEE